MSKTKDEILQAYDEIIYVASVPGNKTITDDAKIIGVAMVRAKLILSVLLDIRDSMDEIAEKI